MSFPLLKLIFKKNFSLMGIFLSVMLFYALVILSMYDPEDIASYTAMYEMMPEAMINAFGFSATATTLTGFLASWLYGFILTTFPLVYSIILSTRLVSKTVDDGSIACLLSAPIKRDTLIFTKIKFATVSLFVIHLITFIVVLIGAQAMFPDLLDIENFIILNITVTLLNICALSICFFCSCIFSDNKKAVSVSSFITVGFLLLNMLGSVSEKSEVLKNFSIYGWFRPEEIAMGEGALVLNLIYFATTITLGALSVIIFRKKNLYI